MGVRFIIESVSGVGAVHFWVGKEWDDNDYKQKCDIHVPILRAVGGCRAR